MDQPRCFQERNKLSRGHDPLVRVLIPYQRLRTEQGIIIGINLRLEIYCKFSGRQIFQQILQHSCTFMYFHKGMFIIILLLGYHPPFFCAGYQKIQADIRIRPGAAH